MSTALEVVLGGCAVLLTLCGSCVLMAWAVRLLIDGEK